MHRDSGLFEDRLAGFMRAGDNHHLLPRLLQRHAHIDKGGLGPAMRGPGHDLQKT